MSIIKSIKTMMKITFISTLLFSVATFAAPRHVLKVGVIDYAPFSAITPQGAQGLAIDIWKLIAQENNWSYRFISAGTNVDRAIQAIHHKKYDVLVGPISVTHERIKLADFSRPYFLNQTIAVLNNKNLHFSEEVFIILKIFLKPVFLIFLFFLLIFIHVFWFIERHEKNDISAHYHKGIFTAAYYVLIDVFRSPIHAPAHWKTRTLHTICSIFVFSFIMFGVATITSMITIYLTKHHESLYSKQQLEGKTFAVMKGSIEENIADQLYAKTTPVKTLQEAFDLLQNKKVFGFISDRLIAQHYMTENALRSLFIANIVLSNNNYVFITQKNSKLTEPLNLALTKLQANKTIAPLCKRYFRKDASYCEYS